MYFKSIEVEQFRQFRDAVAVRDLTARLNVIAGPNEAGKSTLLQALRAVLFDRYTGSVGERFRPYGAAVSPKVRLVFELDETEYRLTKVFSRRRDGEATLEASGGRRWEGPAAEDHLAELLGFSYASRGGSRPELQGLAGLLWVEQAGAYAPVTLTDQSRRQVHAVFEHDMRELLGGDRGEALHRRIETLREEYFTARGKPRGDYRRCEEQEAELRRELQAKQGELKAYEDKVDRLERLRTELLAYRRDRLLEKAEERVRSAQAAADRVEALRAQVQAGKEQLARTQAERSTARQAWDSRARLIDEIEASRTAERTAAQAVDEQAAESRRRNDRLIELRNELSALETRRRDRDAELSLARDAEALAALEAEHRRLDARLRQARNADAERRRCLSERDAIRVTAELVTELKETERGRDLAAARLHAAATQVEYRLEPGAEVRLGGAPLTGDGSVSLARRTELRIRGIGRFAIIPGGEDLEVLQRGIEEAKHRLTQGLAAADVRDLAAAETLLHRRRDLDSRASQHAAILAGLTPEGLHTLEDRLSAIGAQRDSLRHKLGENAGRTFRMDDLEREARTLQDQVAVIRGRVEDAEQGVQALRESLAGLRAEKLSAERLVGRCASELEQARLQATDERLMKALAESEQAVGVKNRHLEAVTRTLEAEDPEVVESEVERSRRARADIEQEIERHERRVRDLEVELDALGQQGLAEAVASIAADHAFAALQLEQAERHARALDLLQRTLDAALRRAKEAVARPVTARLVPYLHRLIPGTAPLVDEDLLLTGIERGGAIEDFEEHLSIGTREQLAVLVRLAYADLLGQAGEPVTLILDDALVNSDDERRERMKAILYQAAKRYQILLLTCHGREYRDTGGTFIRLENALGTNGARLD